MKYKYIETIEDRARDRMVSLKTLIYQDTVEKCIEDHLLDFIRDKDLSLTDVYINTYLKQLNNFKRIIFDWQEAYTKLMVKAYQRTLDQWS
jgi:hypothetical protein